MTDLVWVVSSCVIILAVIAIRAIFGRRMSAWLRCALWTLVLIRLLIPWTVFSSPISVKSAVVSTEIGENLEAIRDVGAVEYGTTDNGVTNVYGWTSQRLAQSGGEHLPEKAVSVMEDVTPERAQRVQKTFEVRRVLTAVWLSGAGLAAAYFIFVNIRFYIRLRGGVRMEADIAPRPVYSVEGLPSSCLFFGSVYVPKETADDPRTLRCVLAHELAHYSHGDTLRAIIWDAVLALHWYNPLVWLAAILARRDSEIYADADAIKALGEDERENYGMALIRLSSKHVSGTNICVAATSMTNGKRTLKERIKHMSNKSKMSFMIALAVILLAAAAVGCSFLGGRGTEADPKDAAVTPEPTVIPTEAVTAAPTSVPTEAPTPEPTDEPDGTPDEWFIDTAWPYIERANELYSLNFERSTATVKRPQISGISEKTVICFSEEDAVRITVWFHKDAAGEWYSGMNHVSLDFDPPAGGMDADKIERDHIDIDYSLSLDISKQDLERAGFAPDGGVGDLDKAARYMADHVAHLFTTCSEDNYFRCSEAAPANIVALTDMKTYSVFIALLPLNPRCFFICYGDINSGVLCDSPEYFGYMTISFGLTVTRNGDDSFTASYEYIP